MKITWEVDKRVRYLMWLFLISGTVAISLVSEMDAIYTAVFAIGILLITAIIHETVHVIIDIVLGYRPSFKLIERGRWIPDPCIICENQRIERLDNIFSLLAPLVVINILSITLLISDANIVQVGGGFALLTNTFLSSADMYNAYRAYKLPEGTLFEDKINQHEIKQYYYKPKRE